MYRNIFPIHNRLNLTVLNTLILYRSWYKKKQGHIAYAGGGTKTFANGGGGRTAECEEQYEAKRKGSMTTVVKENKGTGCSTPTQTMMWV